MDLHHFQNKRSIYICTAQFNQAFICLYFRDIIMLSKLLIEGNLWFTQTNHHLGAGL